MRLRTLTKWLVLLLPLAVGLYDLAALWWGGNEATISRYMLAGSAEVAATAITVTFGFGVLAGHFWLPQHPDPVRDKVPGRLG